MAEKGVEEQVLAMERLHMIDSAGIIKHLRSSRSGKSVPQKQNC